MGTILTYISVNDGKIRRSSLELLSKCTMEAKNLGYTSAALLIDENAGTYTDEVKRYGPSVIYLVEGTAYRNHLNSTLLRAMTTVMNKVEPAVFAFASTESSKDILGALAANQNVPALTDMSEFGIMSYGVKGKRPVMAGKILSVVEAENDTVLLSVRSGSYEIRESPSESQIENIEVPDHSGSGISLKEILVSAGNRMDLSEADIIIAAGRGVRDEKGVQLISDLASVLNAGIGASRALTESGMYDPALQIGQTGKVVSPSLYIAVGISGAIQHIAGITNSRVIVAINKDPDAPIFDVADYGMVGDLYEILPCFIEELKKLKAS